MDDFDDFARDTFDGGTTRARWLLAATPAVGGAGAMRDDASLSDDARGRGSFHVTARRPRASRVSEDGLLVRAWGTSGDPADAEADARGLGGDAAPNARPATVSSGNLDHATGVPRFGKGAEMGADTWSLAREGFDADDGARDETEPPAAAAADVEETDDHHEIEATREGTPGEPTVREPTVREPTVRGNHPTPPAARDHDITAALFEDPVAGGGTPTPAPSPAGVNHERGWWIRTRGDASHPTPPR